jgi:5-methylcytosine-specific restriction endonuclease McrA
MDTQKAVGVEAVHRLLEQRRCVDCVNQDNERIIIDQVEYPRPGGYIYRMPRGQRSSEREAFKGIVSAIDELEKQGWLDEKHQWTPCDWVGYPSWWWSAKVEENKAKAEENKGRESYSDPYWRTRESADAVRELRKMPYRKYLQTPHWASVRRAAIKRAGGCCQRCFSPTSLEVHHHTYKRRGREHADDVIVLCAGCHGRFHKRMGWTPFADRYFSSRRGVKDLGEAIAWWTVIIVVALVAYYVTRH